MKKKCFQCGYMSDKTMRCKKCGNIVCIYCASISQGLCSDCMADDLGENYSTADEVRLAI